MASYGRSVNSALMKGPKPSASTPVAVASPFQEYVNETNVLIADLIARVEAL